MSGYEVEHPSGITQEGRKFVHDPVRIDWASGDTSLLGSPIILSRGTGETVTDWTKTITSYGSGATVSRLRFTPPTSTTGPNTRLWYPFIGSDSINSEVRTLIYGHSRPGITGSSTGNGQIGHFHRAGATLKGGTKPWGFIVWHDVVFALDDLLNLGAWTTDGATSPPILQNSETDTTNTGQLPGLQNIIPAYATSRVGSTVTVTTIPNHGIEVGDVVVLEGGTELDDIANLTNPITAVGTGWVQWTSTLGSTNVPFGGAGQLRNLTKVMPYWLASRLDGMVLRAKAWPMGKTEPAWDDQAYSGAVTMGSGNAPPATAKGTCGIYIGHMTTPVTSWCEIGSTSWRSLD